MERILNFFRTPETLTLVNEAIFSLKIEEWEFLDHTIREYIKIQNGTATPIEYWIFCRDFRG